MKILFVGRSIAHFSYYETIIRSLVEKGHRVHLLYDKKWSRKWSDSVIKKFVREHNAVSWTWALRRKGYTRNLIFAIRELLSYISYLHRHGQSDYYLKRWQGYLPKSFRPGEFLDQTIVHYFLKLNIVNWLLKMFEYMVPADVKIKKSLKKIAPDVVIVTPVNMRYSEDIEYLKAAKSLKIPTVLPVLSWDNLTTKGLIHIQPDRVFVWNDVQKIEAMSIHNIPEHRIEITGSPFFDKWFSNNNCHRTRDEFCRQVGLIPKYPFFLYLGSSANIVKDETYLIKKIFDSLKQHPDANLRNAGIIVRPHPANYKQYAYLDYDSLIVLPKKGALPEDDASKLDFLESLKYCSLTIGVNTSGMLDAIINKKPCIAIRRDELSKTQVMTSHFKALMKTNVLSVAETMEDMQLIMLQAITGKLDNNEKMDEFISMFVRPVDINTTAGDIAARKIEQLVGK
jgi:hypothetical protein